MRIAVVGSGGFLGNHLASHLTAAGHQVSGIGRATPLPLPECDVVIDCNGDPRRFFANAHPFESFQANVARLAERLVSRSPGLYVYMSTMDVLGSLKARRPENHEGARLDTAGLDVYGFHKFLAEQLVAYHAPRHLILRLGTLIGPGLKKNPVFDAVNRHPIRQTPESTLSLIDLDRVAGALDRLLAAGAEGIFNLTGSRSVLVSAMLEAAGELLGYRDFTFHPEQLHTDYDINVDKIERLMPMPSSENMLRAYLAAVREGKA